jgi:hypothetical protein
VKVRKRKEKQSIPLILPPTTWRPFQATVGNRLAGWGTGLSWSVLALVSAVLLCSCNLTPARPDAIFTVYRDRMKAENIAEARKLLTDQSRDLAVMLESTFKLRQSPEDLALLNAVDPVGPPVVIEKTDTLTLLQVRTLKGGVRSVRLTRPDSSSAWRIDLAQELASLESFLQASRALDDVRGQAGEFAATWKALSDRLGTIHVPEPPAVAAQPPKTPPKPKPPTPKKPQKRHDKKKDAD